MFKKNKKYNSIAYIEREEVKKAKNYFKKSEFKEIKRSEFVN